MTYDNLIDMLTAQVTNLPTYGAALGVTPAMITEVGQRLGDLIQMRDYAEAVDSSKRAVTQIKNEVLNGDPNEPPPVFPTFPAPDFLVDHPVKGIWPLTQELNKFMKASPNYTLEAGIALGIAGAPQTIDPGTIIPNIVVTAAQSDFLFSIVVSDRGQSDMWEVQTTKVGANVWTVAKSSTGKSTDVTMPPNDPEAPGPYQIQVRVRLKRLGNNYGQLSNIVQVTVNP